MTTVVRHGFQTLSRLLRRTPLRRVGVITRVHSWLFRRLAFDRTVQVAGFRVELDPRDELIAKKLALYGEYEPYFREVMLAHARPGTTVLDVGANVGLHTLALARRVGPSGQVLAFEPDPDNAALLVRNCAANGITNVVASQVALGVEAGMAPLYQSRTNRGALSLHPDNVEGVSTLAPVTVPVVVGDAAFREMHEPISLIKIDVEGAEPLVLAGLRDTLARNPEAILLLEFFPEFVRAFGTDPRQFLDTLEGSGYTLSLVDEATQCCTAMPSAALFERSRREQSAINLLAVRAGEPGSRRTF